MNRASGDEDDFDDEYRKTRKMSAFQMQKLVALSRMALFISFVMAIFAKLVSPKIFAPDGPAETQ